MSINAFSIILQNVWQSLNGLASCSLHTCETKTETKTQWSCCSTNPRHAIYRLPRNSMDQPHLHHGPNNFRIQNSATFAFPATFQNSEFKHEYNKTFVPDSVVNRHSQLNVWTDQVNALSKIVTESIFSKTQTERKKKVVSIPTESCTSYPPPRAFKLLSQRLLLPPHLSNIGSVDNAMSTGMFNWSIANGMLITNWNQAEQSSCTYQ